MELQQDILFYHVMKTAGTSIVKYLEEPYGASSMCPLPTHQGDDESAFLQGVADGSPKVISGHPDHLFHLWDQVHARSAPRFTLTFLRNPVDRYLSCYYFWTRSKFVNSHVEQCDLSLEETLDGDNLKFADNIMTKALASLGAERDYSIPATSKDLLEAFANLKKMDFIGLVEELRLSCAMLANKLDFAPGVLPAWNVNTPYPGKAEHDKTLIRKIMLKNIYDMELYNHAKELFVKEISESDANVETLFQSLEDSDVTFEVKQK